jgi:KaiC/GvpD/RAD55 family RecA-like ATPase
MAIQQKFLNFLTKLYLMERVKTGIKGLDEILNGGIPKRNIVLLSGGPGTGKLILGQQFIYCGLESNEAGIIVTLEEHPVQVRVNMSQFGWDIREFEEEGKFAIVDGSQRKWVQKWVQTEVHFHPRRFFR